MRTFVPNIKTRTIMIGYIGVFILGAIAALLVVGNNPKIGAWFYKISNGIEKVIENQTGKDI